jgi:hypothetical protein
MLGFDRRRLGLWLFVCAFMNRYLHLSVSDRVISKGVNWNSNDVSDEKCLHHQLQTNSKDKP